MPAIQKFFAVLLWIPLLIWSGGERLYYHFRAAPQFPPTEFGVTFSTKQAEALGLDPREVYSVILDDLGAKRLRLIAYWDQIEPKEKDSYDFSTLDWQMQGAEAHNAKVVLAVGIKLPRWPECHIPQWAKDFYAAEPESIYQLALDAVKETISRYKDSPSLEYWQVENEPFYSFGDCPPLPGSFVESEVKAVHELDSKHPVIISDSGELGTWTRAAQTGDIVGTTIYRRNYKNGYGYINYPLPPEFYANKAELIKKIYGKNVMVVELQAEPWVQSPPISNYSIKDQFVGMNFDLFKKNVAFADQTHLSPVYLWGAEWWYWMKLHDHPEFWNYARDKFSR